VSFSPVDPAPVLAGQRIVPVVVIDDATVAPQLARALTDGGIGCAEITLRTPAGLEAIRAASQVPGFIVGAGTVTTPAQVDSVVDAGAAFLVSPGLDDAVVARAAQRGVPILPGVATATEVQRAIASGLSVLKLFPANLVGGLDAVRAFAGPFPEVRFVPSGGVSDANAREYLASPSVFAVSGSWMVPREAIAAGDLETVSRLSAQAVAALA
jgi:2-dehydro-3-deoxyphosphogluconate aldolase / (4S)-4-hydroxy-2-oxoglutarate aldolase